MCNINYAKLFILAKSVMVVYGLNRKLALYVLLDETKKVLYFRLQQCWPHYRNRNILLCR